MAARAVVVGAGIGGLSAAAMLAARGLDVTVLERAAAPGGKMRALAPAGRPMDAGPTVFTMKWVFDELFDACGADFDARVALTPVARLARHGWTDGARFDLMADPDAARAEVARFAGAAEAARFDAFRGRVRRIHDALERPFIAGQRPGMAELLARVGPRRLAALVETTPFVSMARALEGSFRDPKLRQLFGRYATYCGSSPYAAPATLMLVAHVELAGVWVVEGGMRALAAAVARLAADRGARLRLGAEVAAVETGREGVTGVRLADGEALPADLVVFNGDVGALADGLLGPAVRGAAAPVPRAERSISAFVWSVDAPAAGFPLIRHTVFFDAGDYGAEFRAIFRDRRVGETPTVYVCAQDRGDEAPPGPVGPERLHVHVNAPADGDLGPTTQEEIARCATLTTRLLARCGLTLDLAAGPAVLTTPSDFASLFPGTGGALFGRTTHGAFGTFRRPGARTPVPGLYLAGGSAHPGAGVPMAAMSGRLAAAAALEDLSRRARDSTGRSRPAAISGGTSTPSRTTAPTA